VIVDTSALLAYFDIDEPDHEAVTEILTQAVEPLVVSPYVVAEVDYLVASRLGVEAELAVLGELAGGAWDLPAIDADGLRQAQAVVERYADQRIGLADASNVVLAAEMRTRTIATLDHRHFDVLRPLSGGRFTVVPSR
jgi:predicted nucleic acid-binding protein